MVLIIEMIFPASRGLSSDRRLGLACLLLLPLLLVDQALCEAVFGRTMYRAIDSQIIRFTLALRLGLSFVGGEDFNLRLVLFVLAFLLVIFRWFVHSGSGISCSGGCLDDLVQICDRLWIFCCEFLSSPFVPIALFEGDNDTVFAHIRDGGADLTESTDINM